ncbi:hypothetical protein Vafri_9337 [Volvox africanus]|uniref:Uncharacterized protein n=1 Tax=Volvox africanus TaxID=51714 RepID=A0A8J4B8N8_9CHLO|nr:hypothetical protein Vafri_9337 [Volvox africanus]
MITIDSTPLKCLYVFTLLSLAFASYNETELRLMYGSVVDWVHFSPRVDISRQCRFGHPLRIAYFSRHSGTLWDWIAVADHLGAPWTRVNPGLFQTYGVNTTAATAIWEDLGHMLCHIADILVFSDTIPDARPLLQGGCTTPIILQITNRFDYGISPSDQDVYRQLMSEVATRKHVWWVVNNPYEVLFISQRGIKLPLDRLLLLRPVGVCLLPPPQLIGRERPRVALVQPSGSYHLENTVIAPWVRSQNLTDYVRMYRQHYGGPTVLAHHRGVITVPYQTSVMKMYEGLTAGAVFIIPSPAFFKKLLDTYNNDVMVFCCRDLMRDRPHDWQEFFDWYHKDFINAHIMYDSWEDLYGIISDRAGSSRLIEEKRAIGMEVMQRSRQNTLDGYSSLYRSVSQQACADTGTADVLSQGFVRRPHGL